VPSLNQHDTSRRILGQSCGNDRSGTAATDNEKVRIIHETNCDKDEGFKPISLYRSDQALWF
jgi:hypothetical protein